VKRKGIFRRQFASASAIRFAAEMTAITGMGLALADRELALAATVATNTIDKSPTGVWQTWEREKVHAERAVEANPELPIFQVIAALFFEWGYRADSPIPLLLAAHGEELMSRLGLSGITWGLLRGETVAADYLKLMAVQRRGLETFDAFLENCILLCRTWQRAGEFK
jgi:hypothetical protein